MALQSLPISRLKRNEREASPTIVDIFPNVKRITVSIREEGMPGHGVRMSKWLETAYGVVVEVSKRTPVLPQLS
jgi:hypothetical protein